MNLINEEIRAIRVTMSHVQQAIPLAFDTGEKLRLQGKYDELGKILAEKLNQCEDYKG